MIAEGHDDHTAVAISGRSSTRRLEQHTHPTEGMKIGALDARNAGREPRVLPKD
jgi:hypothetical protein